MPDDVREAPPPEEQPPEELSDAQRADLYDRVGRKNNLDPNLMWAVRAGEGTLGDRFAVSQTGAAGPFQFTRATALHYGVTNRFSEEEAAEGAGRYLRENLDRYKGDLSKALSDYNAGPDQKKWTPEVGDYASKVLGAFDSFRGKDHNSALLASLRDEDQPQAKPQAAAEPEAEPNSVPWIMQKIQQAKGVGYDDQKIADHLKTNETVQGLLATGSKNGWSDKDVFDRLGLTKYEPPSFIDNVGTGIERSVVEMPGKVGAGVAEMASPRAGMQPFYGDYQSIKSPEDFVAFAKKVNGSELSDTWKTHAIRLAHEKLDGGEAVGFDDFALPAPQNTQLGRWAKSSQEWADKNIPMTPEERSSVGGQLGQILGGVAVTLPLTIVGPAGVAAAAGVFGFQGAADAAQTAREKGASEEQTQRAARLNFAVNTAAGAVDLGAILMPVSQASPGFKAWAAAKFAQAARNGVTFPAVGEAQAWLGAQIEKEYDPHAQYDFDWKRAAAGLIGGATVGVASPLHGKAEPTPAEAAHTTSPEANQQAPEHGTQAPPEPGAEAPPEPHRVEPEPERPGYWQVVSPDGEVVRSNFEQARDAQAHADELDTARAQRAAEATVADPPAEQPPAPPREEIAEPTERPPPAEQAPAEPAPISQEQILARARESNPELFGQHDQLTQRQEVQRGWLQQLRSQGVEQAVAPIERRIAQLDQQMQSTANQHRRGQLFQTVSALRQQAEQMRAQAQSNPARDVQRILADVQKNDQTLRDLGPQVNAAFERARAELESKPRMPPPEAAVEPKPTQPAPQPAAAQAPEPARGNVIDLSGMGKGMMDNLYEGLFQSLQQGKDTFAGIKDSALVKAKPFFDRGEIRSPEDLKRLIASGYNGAEQPQPALFGRVMDQRAAERAGQEAAPAQPRESGVAGALKTGVAAEAIRPQPGRLRFQMSHRMQNILLQRLRQLIGDKAALGFVDALREGSADGSFETHPVIGPLIKIARDLRPGRELPVLHHEILHALRAANVFSKGQWMALVRRANKYADPRQDAAYRAQLLGDAVRRGERLSPADFVDQMQEERVAWMVSRHLSGQEVQPGSIGRVIGRVKEFFDALSNAWHGEGFQTAEGTLRRIEGGQYGEPVPHETPLQTPRQASPAYALREWNGKKTFFDPYYEHLKPNRSAIAPKAEHIPTPTEGVYPLPKTLADKMGYLSHDLVWDGFHVFDKDLGYAGDLFQPAGHNWVFRSDKGMVHPSLPVRGDFAADVPLADRGRALEQRQPMLQAAEAPAKYALRNPQIDTPEFKRWFGDSKVVDENGEPRVVYHGTNQPIDNFLKKRLGIATGQHAGQRGGFFFSSSPDVASQYAAHAGKTIVHGVNEHEKNVGQARSAAERLERIAQRTNRPEDWRAVERAHEAWENLELGSIRAPEEIGQNVVPAYLAIGNPMVVDAGGGPLFNDINRRIVQAKQAGHDGMIIHNVNDTPNHGVVADNYVAFRSEQVKSATGNSGAFDPNDRRIAFALRDDETERQQGPNMPAKKPGVGGLLNPLPTPHDVGAKLHRALQRGPEVGAPRNDAVRVGKTIVGKVNFRQWLNRVEATLTPEDISEARRWYRDALPTYEKYFGKDKAPAMLGAWLTANVNATPSFAQLSATRTLEQYLNRTREHGEQKQGGLADDKLFRYWDAVLSGDLSKLGQEGSGQKIYDFIDSALGKDTRTFYGDDPRLGGPAVADVHSLRDMGFVDEAMVNWARDTYGEKAAARLSMDMKGLSPGEAQYEWAADKMRDFTKRLNQIKYDGGNWSPHEMQAVGWTAMSKLLGRRPETSGKAVEGNIRNLSYELEPGAGAPYEKQFPQLASMMPIEKAQVAAQVLPKVMDFVKGITGAHEFARVEGLGGWHEFTNPSFKSRLIASPEVAGDVADMLGYLTQQTKVFAYRLVPTGKRLGVAIYGEGLKDPAAVAKFWDALRQVQPDFAAGFSPSIDAAGTHGMEIILDKGGEKLAQRIREELVPAIERVAKDQGLAVDVDAFRAAEESRDHDWQTDPTGWSYLSRLSGRYGPEIRERLELFKRQELEPAIHAAIADLHGVEGPQPRYSLRDGEARLEDFLGHREGLQSKGFADRPHAAAAHYVMSRGRETGHEYAVLLHPDGTPLAAATSNARNEVGIPPAAASAVMKHGSDVVYLHNHPENGGLSQVDYGLTGLPGMKRVLALTQDGHLSSAALDPAFRKSLVERGWPDGHDLVEMMEGLTQTAAKAIYKHIVPRLTSDEQAHDVTEYGNDLVGHALAGAGVLDYVGTREPPPGIPDALIRGALTAARHPIQQEVRRLGYRSGAGHSAYEGGAGKPGWPAHPEFLDHLAELDRGAGEAPADRAGAPRDRAPQGDAAARAGTREGPRYALKEPLDTAALMPEEHGFPAGQGSALGRPPPEAEMASPTGRLHHDAVSDAIEAAAGGAGGGGGNGPSTEERALKNLALNGETRIKNLNALERGTFVPGTITPPALAKLDTMFARLWNSWKARDLATSTYAERMRSTVADSLVKLPAASRDRVYAALELARIYRWRPEDNGQLVRVFNRHTWFARKSRPGDDFTLNTAETRALHDAIKLGDEGRRVYMEALARREGWKGPIDLDQISTEARRLGASPEGKRMGRLAAVLHMAEKDMARPYFPAMRFGDYYLAVKPKEMAGADPESLGGYPEVKWFETVERPAWDHVLGIARRAGELPALQQRITEIRAMKDEQGKQRFPEDKFDIETGDLKKKQNILRELSIPAIDKLMMLMERQVKAEAIEKTLRRADEPAANKAEARGIVNDQWARTHEALVDTLMEETYREMLAGFKREAKMVPGWSGDFDRAIGAHTYQLSRNAADMVHRNGIDQAYQDLMTEHPEDSVRDYTRNWRRYMEEPEGLWPKIANTMAGYGFAYALALNPSSTFIFAAHTPMAAAPVLSVGVGMGRASKELGKALGRAYRRAGFDLKQGAHIDMDNLGGNDPAKRAYFERLKAEGLLHAIGADDLSALNDRAATAWGSALKPTMRRAFDVATSNIRIIDQANRLGIADAAYELAKNPETLRKMAEPLLKHDETFRDMVVGQGLTPETFGRFMLGNAGFEWGKAARAPIQRGGLGTLLFTLHGFQTRYLSTAFRLMKNMGSEGRIAAGWMLGALAMGAGAYGMPFTQDLENVADKLWTMLTGHDPMIHAHVQKFLAEDAHFGKVGAEMFLHGPLSEALGTDMAARIGFGDVFSREMDPSNALGTVPAIIGSRLMAAKRREASGQGLAAAGAELLPSGLRNPAVAAVQARQGVLSQKGAVETPKEQVTAGDTARRALGFNPMSQTRRFETQDYRYRLAHQDDQLRGDALHEAALLAVAANRAAAAGDNETAVEARRQLNELRQQNPTLISPKALQNAIKRAANPGQAQIMQMPKRLRGQAVNSPFPEP